MKWRMAWWNELARLAIDHHKKDHREALLHLGVLAGKLVQDDLGFRTAFEADDDAHSIADGSRRGSRLGRCR